MTETYKGLDIPNMSVAKIDVDKWHENTCLSKGATISDLCPDIGCDICILSYKNRDTAMGVSSKEWLYD